MLQTPFWAAATAAPASLEAVPSVQSVAQAQPQHPATVTRKRKSRSAAAVADAVNRGDYESLHKKDLQEMLRSHKLGVTGRMDELIQVC